MRLTALAAVAIIGLAGVPFAANAVPGGTNPVTAGAALPGIVPVAEGCGAGFHWVDGYRRPDGVWVPAHCQPN